MNLLDQLEMLGDFSFNSNWFAADIGASNIEFHIGLVHTLIFLLFSFYKTYTSMNSLQHCQIYSEICEYFM